MSQYNEKYRKLVIKILTEGHLQDCRNGEQLIIPSYSFTIDDMENDHKLLFRKMYYKGVLGEFLTLIDSEQLTNVSQFEANGCNYWSEWSGPNGELNLDYHDELVKQLPGLIEGIKTDPNSRRHVINLWNPERVQFTKAFNAGKSTYTGNIMTHPEYRRWTGQKERTRNPNDPKFKHYGGRGITFSEEFEDFYVWLGHIELLPNYGKEGYTLDRQNNDKGYERGNLVWSSWSSQNINQRMKGNNTSGFAGVSLKKDRNKFVSTIMLNGERKNLGHFDTVEEGALVRDNYIIDNNLEHNVSHLSCKTKEYLTPLSLECCWYGMTFSIINKTLHMTFNQRSVDTMVGLPSDVYLAYLFMDHIAKETNLKIGSCMFSLSNCHIYADHIENAYKLVTDRTIEDFDNPLKFQLKA